MLGLMENQYREDAPMPQLTVENWPDLGRDIHINKVVNGIVVLVGCKHFVFTDIETMLDELRKYLCNPRKTEKEYMERYKTQE
jgi:hypothetical protein